MLFNVPLWDVELRRLAFLLNTKEVSSPRIPGVLVREVTRLAHARGRTLNDAVAEAMQLWAWRELGTISAVTEDADSVSARCNAEAATAARRQRWGEIDTTLSVLRMS